MHSHSHQSVNHLLLLAVVNAAAHPDYLEASGDEVDEGLKILAAAGVAQQPGFLTSITGPLLELALFPPLSSQGRLRGAVPGKQPFSLPHHTTTPMLRFPHWQYQEAAYVRST